MRSVNTLIWLSFLVVGACDSANPPIFEYCESDIGPGTPVVDATYYRDIAPIVEGRCARCHTSGGIAPFALETYTDVVTFKDAVRSAVVEKRMPPWLPADCCQSFAHNPSLTDDQIATVAAWVDRGAPEGIVDEKGPALDVGGGLPRVDLSLTMTTGYMPAPPEGQADDSRCFLIEWPFSETKYVTGFRFNPGNPALVHHAIVLTLSPGATRRYQRISDASGGFGWSCPGGVVTEFTGYAGSYGPGWSGQETPPGHGHEVQPNTKLLLTVHYKLPANAENLVADQSSFDLMLADSVENTLTAVAVYNGFWPYGFMPIEAGDTDSVHRAQYDATALYSASTPMTIHSVNLHMHALGVKGVLGIRRADGTDECLLQVDAYDHAWQDNFILEEPVVMQPGDQAFVECRFDNSDENQPVILGERQETKDLNWGDAQEMCIGYLTVTSHKWGSRLTGGASADGVR
jgi:hypothetical protein